MEIFVNGKRVMMKKDSSFEFVAENRLFSGSDSYTLDITLPLEGSKENREVFGNIRRPDVEVRDITFDCEIRDKSFIRTGSVIITDISPKEVKLQFLEGRAEQNAILTLDDIYINELLLGSGIYTAEGMLTEDRIPPAGTQTGGAWNPATSGRQFVSLPWVIQNTGRPQNFTRWNPSGAIEWTEPDTGKSSQPYLWYIIQKICDAVGYTVDLRQWLYDSKLKWLLVCNTLPTAWDLYDFGRALPHWTVSEFFEKLEIFLNCEFDIDHRMKHISFRKTVEVQSATDAVYLDRVINDHTVEISAKEADCDYLGERSFAYSAPDTETWKYLDCRWYAERPPLIGAPGVDPQYVLRRFTNLEAMMEGMKEYANYWTQGIAGVIPAYKELDKLGSARLYAAEEDLWFFLRTVDKEDTQKSLGLPVKTRHFFNVLQPLNVFGSCGSTDSGSEEKIDFVPVPIEWTDFDHGFVMHLPFSSYSEEIPDDPDYTGLPTGGIQKGIDAGEDEGKAEYYDTIFLGWWNGHNDGSQLSPHPLTYRNLEYQVTTVPSGTGGIVESYHSMVWEYFDREGYDFRLNEGERKEGLMPLDTTRKYKFKFLSKSIPNPRSIFIIHGKRYVCEKITATFTDSGLSEKMSGEFWAIDESALEAEATD